MARKTSCPLCSPWILLTSVVSALTLVSWGYRTVQAAEHGSPKEEHHAEAHTAEAKHGSPEEEHHAEAHPAEVKHGSPEEVHHAEAHTAEAKHGSTFVSRVLVGYKTLFSDFTSKFDELKRADEENVQLRQENANFRLQLEGRDFECRSKLAAQRTHEYGAKLEGETGVVIGRTLASIQYEIPTQIQPPLLHTLAVTYFKAGEDEKAAKILHFLLGLETGEFRTPKNILMAGILWYRLDNARIADAMFGELLEHKGKEQPSTSILAQARLWRALTASKRGDRARSQDLLRDLLSHNPHSTEAAWVNRSTEAGRVPGSEH